MFRIELNTDNAAFGDEPEYEVGRILRQIVRSIESDGLTDQSLYDYNGNSVGEVIVSTNNTPEYYDSTQAIVDAFNTGELSNTYPLLGQAIDILIERKRG